MICVSIQNKTLKEILDILAENNPRIEMAEIRLDLCPLSEEDIEELFSSVDIPLVATCRIGKEVTPQVAEKRLAKAIEAGAQYVDLEIEAPASTGKKIRRISQDCGTIFIRSYHDFQKTGSIGELTAMVRKCKAYGADLVKLVTTAHNEEDAERVMSLYPSSEDLIAFCMGESGSSTRLECLKRGAPFTYAALNKGDIVAPGQLPAADMMKSLYGGWQGVHPSQSLNMPASKSFAQRAIIAAALADGTSHLEGYSPCGDNESAIEVAKTLGAIVSKRGNMLIIKGIAAKFGSLSIKELCTGESGLLTRLMIPILAAVNKGNTLVSGVKTLVSRPLSGARNIMASFGVMLKDASEHSSGSGDCFVPLTVNGPLTPGKADISGKDGSQLISGLLMSLPLCDKPSTVYVHDPKSIPYMFITMDVLKHFGINIVNEMEGGDDFLETQDWSLCTGMTFRIKGGQTFLAADFNIEADWSSAANFLVAGALYGDVELKGLDTRSLQADLTIMDILVEAGACISQTDEPYGTIHVQRSPLKAFNVNADNCPDLFPIIAILAAYCQGTSRIGGVGRLVHKESNRAKAITDMLTQMGVVNSIEDDEMVIVGHSLSERLMTGSMVNGGKYTSNHDHRMVMALKVAGIASKTPITIDDEDCVGKSFPTFSSMFEELIKQ